MSRCRNKSNAIFVGNTVPRPRWHALLFVLCATIANTSTSHARSEPVHIAEAHNMLRHILDLREERKPIPADMVNLLRDRSFDGLHIDDASLEQLSFNGTVFDQVALARANFAGSQMVGGKIRWSNLDSSSFVGAQLPNSRIFSTSLRGTDFTDANLTGTKLRRVDLTNANFQNATLRRTHLRDVDMTGVNLDGANISLSDWREAKNLTPDMLENTKLCPLTKLPWRRQKDSHLPIDQTQN